MQLIDINTSFQRTAAFLKDLGWLGQEQIIDIQSAGEGNMNVVLRITTDRRSFIFKQSRPFVQKYQDIEAPLDRINTEYQFYRLTSNSGQNANMPQVLGFNREHHAMILEDLGQCEDMSSIYASRSIEAEQLASLINVVLQIHGTDVDQFPSNLALRQLNHQHIFSLPFMEDNGFDLDAIQNGLQDLSQPYKKDSILKKKIEVLGNLYLSNGTELIHGDYYPGSWMKGRGQLYVIDPEFSFIGHKEFDLGVMAAHLIMATADKQYLAQVISNYQGDLDKQLVLQFGGVEILRRLIGLAQLPLERTLQEKKSLLELARSLVLGN